MRGLQRQVCLGDGNCFFSFLVANGAAPRISEARASVVDYLSKHWAELAEQEAETQEDRLSRMAQDGEFAENLEIHAAAACFGVRICLLSPYQDPQTFGDAQAAVTSTCAFDGMAHYDAVALALSDSSDDSGDDAPSTAATALVPLPSKEGDGLAETHAVEAPVLADVREHGPQCLKKAVRHWESEGRGAQVGKLSTPWLVQAAGWRSTASCGLCIGCAKGSGKRFRFTGRWEGERYILQVRTTGACAGGPKVLRVSAASLGTEGGAAYVPLTRQSKKDALVALADVERRSPGPPPPFAVHVHMKHRGMPLLALGTLRALLHRQRRQRRATPLARALTWSKPFSDYIAAHQDCDSGRLAVVHSSLGPRVTTLAVLLPPFFAHLSSLQSSGWGCSCRGMGSPPRHPRV